MPVRRYIVFRCRGFLPVAYARERVLRSLESPLPLCIYRIAYFHQKNNRHDIRISSFIFVLIYKIFFFALYCCGKSDGAMPSDFFAISRFFEKSQNHDKLIFLLTQKTPPPIGKRAVKTKNSRNNHKYMV